PVDWLPRGGLPPLLETTEREDHDRSQEPHRHARGLSSAPSVTGETPGRRSTTASSIQPGRKLRKKPTSTRSTITESTLTSPAPLLVWEQISRGAFSSPGRKGASCTRSRSRCGRRTPHPPPPLGWSSAIPATGTVLSPTTRPNSSH